MRQREDHAGWKQLTFATIAVTLGVLWLIGACAQLLGQTLPPAHDWPDTRILVGINVDPVAQPIARLWLPSDSLERALCLYGRLAPDSSLQVEHALPPDSLVHVTSFDGRVGVNVFCNRHGPFIGIVHTHPHRPLDPHVWHRSPEDAWAMANDPSAILDIIVFGWQWASWWLRDGRFGIWRIKL